MESMCGQQSPSKYLMGCLLTTILVTFRGLILSNSDFRKGWCPSSTLFPISSGLDSHQSKVNQILVHLYDFGQKLCNLVECR